MNSISRESDPIEPGRGLPVEANVIVLNADNVQSTHSDKQGERHHCVKYGSDDKVHQLLDLNTSNSDNKILFDDVVINIETDTRRDGNDKPHRNNDDIRLIVEENSMNSSKVDIYSEPLLSPEDNEISKEESYTKTDVQRPEYETLNRLLNELHEKELDLHNRYSDQELTDIREAVVKQVNLIAQRIYEIDSRLKTHEILLVGSAREGTQIIRPCEYDFILILDALSKRGAVSIIPEDQEGDSREYMHVKLKDEDIRSIFHEFSDNDCIRASRLLPWDRQGLRDLFSTAVHQAVELSSKSYIKMDTGILKLIRSKPKRSGPACTIRLLWERDTAGNHSALEISVDLCSAIKLDVEEYYRLLPISKKTITNDFTDIQSTDSSDKPVSDDLDHTKLRDSDQDHNKYTWTSMKSETLNQAKSTKSVLSSSGNIASNDLNHTKCGESVSSPSCNIVSKDIGHTKRSEPVLSLSGNMVQNDLTHTNNTKSVLYQAGSIVSNDVDHAKSIDLDFTECIEPSITPCDFNYAKSVKSTFCNKVANHLDHTISTESVLSASGNVASNDEDHAKRIESVLLMPRSDMRFKVTFTEAELQLTLNLSGHHRKCYRLLKYIVNKEPFPFERNNRIKKFIGFLRRTGRHSYILKRLVWDHYYIKQCDEEIDLGLCVDNMLQKLKESKDFVHPFNRRIIIDTSKCSDKINDYKKSMSGGWDILHLNNMSSSVQKVKNTPIEEYDYEACRNAFAGRRYVFYKIFVLLMFWIIIIITVGLLFFDFIEDSVSQQLRDNEPMFKILYCTALLLPLVFLSYILFGRIVVYSKWTLLANRLSLCTENVDYWVFCTFLALLSFVTLLLIVFYPGADAGIIVGVVLIEYALCGWLVVYVLYRRVNVTMCNN